MLQLNLINQVFENIFFNSFEKGLCIGIWPQDKKGIIGRLRFQWYFFIIKNFNKAFSHEASAGDESVQWTNTSGCPARMHVPKIAMGCGCSNCDWVGRIGRALKWWPVMNFLSSDIWKTEYMQDSAGKSNLYVAV